MITAMYLLVFIVGTFFGIGIGRYQILRKAMTKDDVKGIIDKIGEI